ncbi:MAG: TfoX/Sxy family DNA transformation protein [Pirellulaceae bacterium]|nr:TfoX/Sxy family DNA transformation protein [Pirellulaceae bacterium]
MKPAADKLYVNLSASQTRKRIKGYGFGVRKVQATGRNQSVVVHTATGQHLEELKALFPDVLSSTSKRDTDTPVMNLRNVGATTAARLGEINVHTQSDLESLGVIGAFRRWKRQDPETNIALLWALAAALTDRDWRDLSESEKAALQAELQTTP